MIYQSLILAAGAARKPNGDYRKCNFLVDEKVTLLEFSIDTFSSAQKTIIALNPSDFSFYENHAAIGTSTLVNIAKPTQGALATSGMCLDSLADDLPVVISAVDGICLGIIEDFLTKMTETEADGGVVIFPSLNPNYSYVRISQGFPIEFAEKVRIGQFATAGIFYFKNKALLTESILWAILNQVKHEDNYYLSSAMNKFVFEGKRVVLFETTEGNYFRFSTEEEASDSRERLRKING